ncbi:MAG: molybdopterin molybdotransferase MoeA [Thermoplasmata archaeon]|nr:molybdopterin molybdotransferase MoeA [Thermoplasmata archaeon]
MPYHGFGRLTPVARVQRLLEAAVRPMSRTESLRLEQAIGRVACQAYTAPSAVPSFRRASWDGYALRSRDSKAARAGAQVELAIVGEQFAETPRRSPLRKGEALEIATGGALPEGADAVAPYEEVRVEGTRLFLSNAVPAGARVAGRGEDFRKGAVLVRSGEVLSAASLGALAATGRSSVRVYERPRVRIIPNGNELVGPGGRLGPGQIYELNHVALASFCSASGGLPSSVKPVRDDPRAILSALRRGIAESDLVLATGGSSVGERDYLPRLFPQLGKLLFHGVAVRPGKPTLAAVSGGRLLLGLPGHPTSCLANAYWLVLPVLRKLARLPGSGWTEIPARMAEPYPISGSGFTTVVPLRVARGRAFPTFKDSSAITSLSGANGFLLRPPGRGSLAKGERVLVSLLPSPLAVPPRPP